MAKPFYSIEEVCERLGQDEDGVKALVRDGKLREFRDAGKVFFKSEDVDKIASPSDGSGSGEITLEAADDELPSLTDQSSGTSMLGLEPLGDDDDGDAPAEKKKKEDTVISASGIGVFDDDELEIDADPMAKTQITEAATSDQVSLEGSGSGSGLLDLTRESDDTSLGAELLDEIYPGEDEAGPAEQAAPAAAEAPVDQDSEDARDEPQSTATAEAAAPAASAMPAAAALAVSADPMEGLFSGLLAGIVILLAVAGSVVAGVLQGFLPDYARFLSNRFWFLLGGAALVPILTLLIGWVIGRASTPRRS